MKRAFILFSLIMLLCVIQAGCSPSGASGTSSDVILDIVDEVTPASQSSVSSDTVRGVASDTCSIEIASTVAYTYKSGSLTGIYGAAEYVNNGTSPIIVNMAHFTFTSADKSLVKDFEPVFSKSCIVKPGESSYAVVWIDDTEFSDGDDVALSVELDVSSTEQNGLSLSVKDLFLADNYPGFTTLYGKLYSNVAESCELNIVYIGFYDDTGAFLGAWYFSKNALIELGDCKFFVEHMRALPIEKLSKSCVKMKAAAFGIG